MESTNESHEQEQELEEEWKIFICQHRQTFGVYNLDTSLSSAVAEVNTSVAMETIPSTFHSKTLVSEVSSSNNNEQDCNISDLLCKPKIQYVAPTILNEELCDELNISTKTKVLYLNKTIDILDIFWKIPIIENWKPCNGIIKKQVKIVSHNLTELEEYQKKIEELKEKKQYYKEDIIKQVNNPNARIIQFKDERKLTVGLSIKDILNKEKTSNVFYNCFAIVTRFYYNDTFKEIHVKVFNTGKMEIPGVLNPEILKIVKNMIIQLIKPHTSEKDEEELFFIEENNVNDDTSKNILINSNFNCGFYINRDEFQNIMHNKYGIETAFDPCSYPGVKCKFYFNNELGFDEEIQKGCITNEDKSMTMTEKNDNQKYSEVSFMVFRTGSILISGSCSEKILRFVYNFIKKILFCEFEKISVIGEKFIRVKNVKHKKMTIHISKNYLNKLMNTK
jgi:hypothetical protein